MSGMSEAETEKPGRSMPLTPIGREMRDEEEASLRDWLDGLVGSDTAVRCAISRKRPLLGPNGENVGGNLETVEDRVDEEYLRETWGGGDFQVRVSRPGPSGNWVFFKSRTIKLAGPPKMNGAMLFGGGPAVAVAGGDDGPLATKAFDSMNDNVRYERERAARAEREAREASRAGGGLDVAALREMNQPLYEQIRASNETVAALQKQLFATAAAPPPRDEFRDRLMENMMNGENARITALRERFDSELRQANEHHREEMRRLHERQAEELKTQEKRHEREIELVQRMVDSEGRAKEVAYGTRTDGLKSENDRLNRELVEARARIGALEQRKDQSITDKADELIKIREALSGLGGAGGDDKEPSWYEKVIGAVGNSEAALSLLNKLSGPGAEAAPPSPQQMLPPAGVPYQANGGIFVRDAMGNVQQINPAMVRRQRMLAAARKRQAAGDDAGEPGQVAVGGEGAPLEPAAPPMRAPAPADVRIAVQFMEGAINNNTSPEAFGATAKSLIPGDILNYIRHVGIDEFLNKVAKLETGSPLTTQRGRTFARAVAKFLLEGSTGEPG